MVFNLSGIVVVNVNDLYILRFFRLFVESIDELLFRWFWSVLELT